MKDESPCNPFVFLRADRAEVLCVVLHMRACALCAARGEAKTSTGFLLLSCRSKGLPPKDGEYRELVPFSFYIAVFAIIAHLVQ